MKKLHLIIFILFTFYLNAATHIVSTSADDGEGSLRRLVADAIAGDSIIFASNIDSVVLTRGHIFINKNLTVTGHNEDRKVSIINGSNVVNQWTRIFDVRDSNTTFNINNLIITKGKTNARSGGIDVNPYCTLIATNCEFKYNIGTSGSAVAILNDMSTFISKKCLFFQNHTQAVAVGTRSTFIIINSIFYENFDRSVDVGLNYNYYMGGIFIAINSIFYKNKCKFNLSPSIKSVVNIYGSGNSGFFINCLFYENQTEMNGGALYVHSNSKAVYLYHNTFDRNKAKKGGAIYLAGVAKIYSYNCIYTGNEENGKVTKEGQIRGEILAGENLIEDGIDITREKIFSNNEYVNGTIMPTAFAKTATKLTAGIETSDEIEKDTILSWLEYDARGYKRSDTGYVTHGAVEYESDGIKTKKNDFLVLPNPTDGDFNIIFDNPATQKIFIELVDLEGKRILEICNAIVSSGYQVYKVDKNNLASATYFIKMIIGEELFVQKIIVNK